MILAVIKFYKIKIFYFDQVARKSVIELTALNGKMKNQSSLLIRLYVNITWLNRLHSSAIENGMTIFLHACADTKGTSKTFNADVF